LESILFTTLYLVTASTTAAAAGAVPIPFADAFLLVPIHVGTLSTITSTYGAPLERAFLTTVVSTIFGSGGWLLLVVAFVFLFLFSYNNTYYFNNLHQLRSKFRQLVH
jgi:uncharacterized protein (DUF697 family)